MSMGDKNRKLDLFYNSEYIHIIQNITPRSDKKQIKP